MAAPVVHHILPGAVFGGQASAPIEGVIRSGAAFVTTLEAAAAAAIGIVTAFLLSRLGVTPIALPIVVVAPVFLAAGVVALPWLPAVVVAAILLQAAWRRLAAAALLLIAAVALGER